MHWSVWCCSFNCLSQQKTIESRGQEYLQRFSVSQWPRLVLSLLLLWPLFLMHQNSKSTTGCICSSLLQLGRLSHPLEMHKTKVFEQNVFVFCHINTCKSNWSHVLSFSWHVLTAMLMAITGPQQMSHLTFIARRGFN